MRERNKVCLLFLWVVSLVERPEITVIASFVRTISEFVSQGCELRPELLESRRPPHRGGGVFCENDSISVAGLLCRPSTGPQA